MYGLARTQGLYQLPKTTRAPSRARAHLFSRSYHPQCLWYAHLFVHHNRCAFIDDGVQHHATLQQGSGNHLSTVHAIHFLIVPDAEQNRLLRLPPGCVHVEGSCRARLTATNVHTEDAF